MRDGGGWWSNNEQPISAEARFQRHHTAQHKVRGGQEREKEENKTK